jgi:hypothetical protein
MGTWATFKANVDKRLTVYTNAVGLTDLKAALVKSAIRDLQSAIPALRLGVIQSLTPTDFNAYGYGARIDLSRQSNIVDLFAQSTDGVLSFYQQVSEAFLKDIYMGTVEQRNKVFVYNPGSGMLVLCPSPINDLVTINIVYDTTGASFADVDTVIFDDDVEAATAEYVLSRFKRDRDHDLAAAQMCNSEYRRLKQKIFCDFRESEGVRKRNHAPIFTAAPSTAPGYVPLILVSVPAALGFGAPGAVGEMALDGDYVYTYDAVNGWAKSVRTF